MLKLGSGWTVSRGRADVSRRTQARRPSTGQRPQTGLDIPGLLRELRPVGQNAYQPMNVEWTDEMAGLLRAAREDLGWSRLHLAAEAGLSERTIVDLENNRRSGEEGPLTPRKDTVRKLVAALHFEELAGLAGVQLPARARGRLRREDQLTAAQTAEVEQFIDWILSRDGD